MNLLTLLPITTQVSLNITEQESPHGTSHPLSTGGYYYLEEGENLEHDLPFHCMQFHLAS